ncbi:hypothetical protein CPLU01_00648 [Colletotrichum plurivorum]|uniref:Uncharacterized protein n=1 Tax=Colletotrichum plurivorum TaxID=2175906 RepID=A0A8H6NR91_9PEZI|nr:hypothetical protein CPLU01_00648 [Colletotrichum plurivorum]
MLVGVIGLIGSILGIWGFVDDQMPDVPKKNNPSNKPGDIDYINTLRVQLGIDGAVEPDLKNPVTEGPGGPGAGQSPKKLAGAGGHFSMVRHFDLNGDWVGAAHQLFTVKDGHFVDLEARSAVGRQVISTELLANVGDICIATMSLSGSDGTRWGWTGDRHCRKSPMCPLETPGLTSDNSPQMPNGESPWCVWVGLRAPTTSASEISVIWPDFYRDSAKGNIPTEKEAKQFCGRSFKAFDEKQKQLLSPGKSVVKKRGLAHWVIVSSRRSRNATAVCQEQSSYGPDFVSLAEGVYCNMETRETLPLCENGPSTDAVDCFDVDSASRVTHVGARAQRPRIQARNPTKVIKWE